LGDAVLFVDEALYNFDLIKLYETFLNLIFDMQLDNGEISNLVPHGDYPSNPNFETALPTITWQLFRNYNDFQILKNT
jgi:hypothetical protein